MHGWSVSQFGLGVVVAVAIIASLGMANPIGKKKFDIVVVADRCSLRGGSWPLTAAQANERIAIAQAIVSAFDEMKNEFDLKIGVFTYDGTDLQTSSSGAFEEPTEVKVLFNNKRANADNCVNVKSRFDSFKEKLKKQGGNRQDAADVIIWMLWSRDFLNSVYPTRLPMVDELQKLFNIPDNGIEGFIAIEVNGDGNVVYKAEQVFLTSQSDSMHTVLPLGFPVQIKATIKASLVDLFRSCSESTTTSPCYYDGNSECIKERIVSTSAAKNLHKFCGAPIGTFKDPCEVNGKKDECNRICDDLIKNSSYVVDHCSAKKCGETGHLTIRPRLDPASKFKNCPNKSIECFAKGCVTDGKEKPKPPPVEPITRRRVTTTTTTESTVTESTVIEAEAALVTKNPSELETWHIVVISLGGIALICVVAIVIICIVVSARKRRAKSKKYRAKGAPSPHRSPNRPHYSPRRPSEMNRGRSNEQSRDRYGNQQIRSQQARSDIDRPATGGDRYAKQQSPSAGQAYRHRSPSQVIIQ